MLTALMIVGAGTQAAFAVALSGVCLAAAGAVVWIISHG